MPYTREGGQIRNAFELHVVSKSSSPVDVVVEPAPATDLDFVIPIRAAHLEPLGSVRVPVFVTMDASRFTADRPFELRVRTVDEHGHAAAKTARGQFLGVKP
jgi:hypothetical protein